MNSCLVLLRPWLAQCKLLKKQFFFWKTSLPSTEFLKVNQKIQPSPYLSITATADLELFLVFSASSLGFILSHPDPIQSSLLTAPAMQPSFSPPYSPWILPHRLQFPYFTLIYESTLSYFLVLGKTAPQFLCWISFMGKDFNVCPALWSPCPTLLHSLSLPPA